MKTTLKGEDHTGCVMRDEIGQYKTDDGATIMVDLKVREMITQLRTEVFIGNMIAVSLLVVVSMIFMFSKLK